MPTLNWIGKDAVVNHHLAVNEIFGVTYHVATFIWKRRTSSDSRILNGVSGDHEYVLCDQRTEGSQRVVLDADLARLYGVTTTAFNQALKRDTHRFPNEFAFQLTATEFKNLMSQTVISSLHAIDSKAQVANRSQTVISSHGGRRKLPWVFTEHGALMAANILRSDHAARMSVFVIRAFVSMREQVAANMDELKSVADIAAAITAAAKRP